MFHRSLLRLALVLFPAGLLAAQATAFKGVPGLPGDVVLYPGGALPQSPPALQGIVLLPVDAAGRAAFTQFQPGQARLKTDIPLASRVLLPGERGSLYRFKKSLPGGAEFGYFLVRPDGLAAFLAAFPGTGPNGLGDPIPNPVAVAEEGDAMLICTSLAAGGDVLELDFVTGSLRSLSGSLPPLDVLPQGLVLLPTWGAVQTSSGPLRFARGGGQLEQVDLFPKLRRRTFVGRPGPVSTVLPYMGNGIVRSADGTTVAIIAGFSAAQAHVFSFRQSGLSICVNDSAGPIADPGFGTQISPLLALSPDGTRAAWKTRGVTGECFSRGISALPVPTEFQITGDQNFSDTLNDTGVISFFDPRTVIVAVGETNGAGGIEQGDIYSARFPTGVGQPVFANLSNTSGDTTAPFLEKGDLDTSDGIFQIPGQVGSVYFVSGSSGQGQIYRLNGEAGTAETIRTGIEALDFIERAGAGFVLGVLHDSPVQREVLYVPFDHAQSSFSMGFYGVTQMIPSRAGNLAGTFAGAMNTGGAQILFQVELPSRVGSVLPFNLPFGSALGFDGNGAVLASALNGTREQFFSWSQFGPSTLHGGGPADSFVLPAN